MRILFVVHQFMPEYASGTEQVTLALAKAAQRSGHRVTVLTCSLQPDAAWPDRTPEGFRRTGVDGIEVVGIPADRLPDEFAATDPEMSARLHAAIDDVLSRGGYDLAHVTHSYRMTEPVARLRAAGIPYVLTLTDFFLLCYRINLVRQNGAPCDGPQGGQACAIHCRRDDLTILSLERRQAAAAAVLRGAAFRIACSDFVADAFRREHPDLAVAVIGHGIDLLRMQPRAARSDARPVFGYVGTVSQAKGVDVMVRAFAAQAAPARLDLFGPLSGDRAFIEEMEAFAAADPRIRLRGAVAATEVPAAMAGFDLLCLPTRLPETFSLALHEGFAAGLPALVSDLGHPARVVRTLGCGQVLPDGDQAAWGAAIGAIAADPSQVERWRVRLPLPTRTEEETFLYSQLYKACIA